MNINKVSNDVILKDSLNRRDRLSISDLLTIKYIP